MRPERQVFSWLVVLALLLPLSASAENSKDFGDFVIHYNAMATDMVPPEVARKYRITRSQNRGMINITVLKKILGSAGQPVHARVEVNALNLAGQGRTISMREIREGNAIYYIGEFGVANEETLNFNVRARPQGTQETVEVRLQSGFLHELMASNVPRLWPEIRLMADQVPLIIASKSGITLRVMPLNGVQYARQGLSPD